MYIGTVLLDNFCCYRRTETTFVHPGSAVDLPKEALANVTLLLGTNGSGKTSILRAVALGVLAPVINESGFRPYYLVRRSKAKGSAVQGGWVSIQGVLSERERILFASEGTNPIPDRLELRVEITLRGDYDIVQFPPTQMAQAQDEYFRDYSPCFFLLGYGANRRVEELRLSALGTDRERGRRYLRTAGLFEEAVALSPLAGWLPQLKKTSANRKRFSHSLIFLTAMIRYATLRGKPVTLATLQAALRADATKKVLYQRNVCTLMQHLRCRRETWPSRTQGALAAPATLGSEM